MNSCRPDCRCTGSAAAQRESCSRLAKECLPASISAPTPSSHEA